METSKLQKTAYAMVIAASGLYMTDTVRDFVAGMTAGVAAAATAKPVQLKIMANTTADSASVTMTNAENFTAESRCFYPEIKNREGKSINGAVVCSGELKPRTTVNLAAPYNPGDVLEICGVDSQYGRRVDWSLCAFDLEPVK